MHTSMKVSAIQKSFYLQHYRRDLSQSRAFSNVPQNLSFGIANAGKLKLLFSYGVPCMYSGIEMLDPPRMQKLLKSGAFKSPVEQLLKTLEPYKNQLASMESRIYKIVEEEAQLKPWLDIKEIFEGLAVVHRKRLRKKQAPIFQKIIEAGHELPDEYRYRFNRFMAETDSKLDGKEVFIPFSTSEFRYKLEKIREDIIKRKENKAVRVLNKMIKEAERLPRKTCSKTEDHQKTIINFLEIIRKRSVLKDYEPLKTLLETSTARLNHEKTKTTFSRKAFIYDLSKLLKSIPDKKIAEEILSIADTLPTSKNSTSAYIIKSSYDPPEKIVYRLLWPSFASVEHILPKSKGGADAMSNFGGATTKENSERYNIDFSHQLKRKPATKINCQKYINRIIDYARNGIFKKHNIEISYIQDFKNTIQKQSKGALVLDIAEFEKKTG